MKIFHIFWSLKFGGIETMVVNIANEQSAMGHDVHIVIVNDMVENSLRERIASSVTFHNIGRKVGSKNPLPVLKLNWLLIKNRPDIVHYHYVELPKLVLWVPGAASVATHHTVCLASSKAYMGKVKNLCAISDAVKADIKDKLGIESHVVINGIDSKSFERRPLGKENGLPLRIVQVGRVVLGIKGQDVLAEAVAVLKQRGIYVQADIIGTGPDVAELEAVVDGLGVGDRINILGAKPQEYLFEHLSDYDLLVQPSRFEGFGLTVAEAMAAQVPVLVSDIPSLLGLVENGKYGYVFHGESPESMADEIVRIMQITDSAKVACAAKRVSELYDVKVTAANYIDFYKKCKEKNC